MTCSNACRCGPQRTSSGGFSIGRPPKAENGSASQPPRRSRGAKRPSEPPVERHHRLLRARDGPFDIRLNVHGCPFTEGGHLFGRAKDREGTPPGQASRRHDHRHVGGIFQCFQYLLGPLEERSTVVPDLIPPPDAVWNMGVLVGTPHPHVRVTTSPHPCSLCEERSFCRETAQRAPAPRERAVVSVLLSPLRLPVTYDTVRRHRFSLCSLQRRHGPQPVDDCGQDVNDVVHILDRVPSSEAETDRPLSELRQEAHS